MTVYLSHATSFCGAVWDPVRALLADVESVAWDHPGHGGGPSVELPLDWRRFGDYVLEVTEPGGVGVGHSMGAAAITMAQLEDPARFRALVLIEPIVFPGPFGRESREPVARRAERRKSSFPSREAAAENFRKRQPFDTWVDAAFEGYLRCGLIGEGEVRLACPPEVEADIYRAWRAHDTWDRLGEIDIPVLVMAGESSDTITPESPGNRRRASPAPAWRSSPAPATSSRWSVPTSWPTGCAASSTWVEGVSSSALHSVASSVTRCSPVERAEGVSSSALHSVASSGTRCSPVEVAPVSPSLA